MQTADVLIVGLKGLGVEIAKNICLAGVKSVTLHDPAPTEIADLGTQFFLRESDIGQPRDQSTLPRIRELNQYVPVNVLGSPSGEQLLNETLSRFKVVVMTDTTLTQQLQVNDYTHANGIHFISADVRGLFGSVERDRYNGGVPAHTYRHCSTAFCDFGPQFPIVDTNGETPLAGMIVSIVRYTAVHYHLACPLNTSDRTKRA